MATPIDKQSPIWLAKQDENDPALHPSYRRTVRYYKALYRAWPDWAAQHPHFKKIKDYAKQLRKQGQEVEIDHIVPICSDIVCGLHVPWNLQVIPKQQNSHKSNRTWPDSPYEQFELF